MGDLEHQRPRLTRLTLYDTHNSKKTKMLTIDTWDHSTATATIALPLLTRDLYIEWQSGSIETVPVRRRDQLKVLAMWMTAPEQLSWGRFANWTKGAGNPAA